MNHDQKEQIILVGLILALTIAIIWEISKISMPLERNLEILNGIGCILTVMGTAELRRKKPNVLYTNILYAISCCLLIVVFSQVAMWANVGMYGILLTFSLTGIKNQRKK